MSQYEITQIQWQVVMQDNPSHFSLSSINRPVECLSWHNALVFCDKLNQKLKNNIPTGYGFSLPTEAQWEYTCRANTQTPYYSGNSAIDLGRVAWFADNSNEETHPVGEKEANAWGFYDMHGNVDEWCYDSPSAYPNTPSVDWIGQGNGGIRALRGGSYGANHISGSLRSACRGGGPSDTKKPWIGFRLCLRGFE